MRARWSTLLALGGAPLVAARRSALPRPNLPSLLAVAFALLLPALLRPSPASAQQLDPSHLQQLRYRFIGPGGNRVSAVVGEPGNPNVYYVGAASGGVWKSTDAGAHWWPVFDSTDVQSIGSIAIDPGRPHTVWVGTGEPFIRSNVSLGDGIYRSTDGGRTWSHLGLEATGRIGRIVIDPRDPDRVYACAMGRGYGDQPERGVYRTEDGGRTWTKVLFVDEHTGCSGLALDPHDPDVLFAGMWQFVIHTWGQNSGGPGSGVFVTRDGGDHWSRLGPQDGLPPSPVGKIDVAVARSDPARVYALIETGGKGSLWRSDDGGRRWRIVSWNRLIDERPHYYTRMLVAPDDAGTVWFPSNYMYVTHDGGETIQRVPWGGDDHDMWADPHDPRRMMIGYDGGVMISVDRGRSWNPIVLPIGQMYHVAVDDRVPYFVYSNMQDDGSVRGPSNSLTGGGISSAIWTTTAGCESGFTWPDTVSGRWVWGGCYSGEVERFDLKTGHRQSVSPWPDKSLDSPAKVLRYRWNWTQPIALSPEDPSHVYVGSQVVHETTDGGRSWKVISPDLTLDDTSRMGSSGGLTPDNLGVEYGGTLFAIAESPLEAGVIWAGSNDGLVHVTRDGGAHWTNVTPDIPDLPPWGTISNIDPSLHQKGKAYISVDFHQVDDRRPYIYETDDYGKSWKKLSGGIPASPLSYVHVVREDPVRAGLLYAGTEDALYVSPDDGAHWTRLMSGLPPAPVTWLTVQSHFHDLVVATKGRGLYILDDISPLEQLTPAVLASRAHLFRPRDAYRFRTVSTPRGVPNDRSRGRNPPYGADLDYFLKSKAKGPVRVTITDDSGRVVRRLTGRGEAGIDRVWWDLRYPPTDEVELRTTPAAHPHIWEEKRFRGKKTREIYHWGIEPPKRGPLVNPGTYTVTVVADGDTLTAPLTVLKDPNTAGTLDDVRAQTKLWKAVYDDIDAVVSMINRTEVVRKQIEDLPVSLQGRADSATVMEAARAVDDSALAVEDLLFQRYLAAADVKTYPAEMKLYLKLVWLAGEVGDGAGDVAGSPDLAPTTQDVEVFHLLEGRLEEARTEFDHLMGTTVPAFNAAMDAKGIGLVVPGA